MNVQAANGALDAAQSIQEIKSAAEKFREEPGGIESALPMISWGLANAAGFGVMQFLYSTRVANGWAYFAAGGGIAVVGALAHVVIATVVGKPKTSFFNRAVGGLWFYMTIAMCSAGCITQLSGGSAASVPPCVMLMLSAGYGVMGVIRGLKYFCVLGLVGSVLAYTVAVWPAYWPLAFAGIQLAGLTLPGLWLLVEAKKCPKTSTT